jgi:hypothetical protein
MRGIPGGIGRNKRLPTSALVLLLFLLLSVYMTRPLVWHFTTAVPGWTWGDNAEYLWKIWWFKQTLLRGDSPWFAPHIFYPFGFPLSYGETTLANIILAWPVTNLLGEEAGYNTVAFLSFVLSGFGMYLLVYRLTGRGVAAILSGIAFAYLPFRYHQLGAHLPLMGSQWTPFFLLYLERFLRTRERRAALLMGFFYALNALTSWYYAVMVGTPALVYMAARMHPWGRYLKDRRFWLNLALAVALVLLLVGPVAIPYVEQRARGSIVQPFAEVDQWSASLTDYLVPNPLHPIWGRWILLYLVPNTSLWIAFEFTLFWGFVPTILGLYALQHGRSNPALLGGRVPRTLGLMALVAIIISMGTTFHFHGRQVLLPLPASLVEHFNNFMVYLTSRLALQPVDYMPPPGNVVPVPMPALLLYLFVPPFNSMRVWSRFGYMADFAVVALAGIGLDEWMRRELPKEKPFLWGVCRADILAIGFTLAVLFEFLTIPFRMIPVEPRPVDLWLAQQQGDFAIFQFPYEVALSGPQMYYTKFNHKKVASGYGTYFPRPFTARKEELRAFPATRSLEPLREWGVRYVLVDPADFGEKWPKIEEEIARQPHLQVVGTFGEVRVYELKE